MVLGGGKNLLRYMKYFTVPLSFLCKTGKYDMALGWQQFYAINLAFFSRLFHVKKRCRLVAVNFTYKRKKGIVGKIYHKFMHYAVTNKYIDYLHVLSYGYAERCHQELGITKDKFIITHFGVPDTYEEWKTSDVDMKDYILSIGRSNRDFDFLVKVWKQENMKNIPLVIISDMWHPKEELPNNVKWLSNVTGDASRPWINCCKIMIIPIDDGNICSGDTVLLNGMMSKKPVIVTTPSTLSEMYIDNGKDGLCYDKDVKAFADKVAALYNDDDRIHQLGENARESYKEKFSRYAMGEAIAKAIKSDISARR